MNWAGMVFVGLMAGMIVVFVVAVFMQERNWIKPDIRNRKRGSG